MWSRLAPLTCVLLLLVAPSLSADEFTQVSHYSAPLLPYETLVINTRVGDVHIEGWDEPRVEIEAEKLVRAGSERKAGRRFKQIRIQLTEGEKEVCLRTIFPPRRPWRLFRGATKLSVNYRIRMPYDANLALKCVNGDVQIRGLVGHQQIRVNYGNVEIVIPSLWRLRSLDARAWLGYVQSDLHGEDSAGFGRKVFFQNLWGEQEIRVRVRFGGVYVYGYGE